MTRLVLFTDLDGTLLDHETYSFRGAVSALDLLRRRQVPVVPVSSKTAPEIELWMRQLCLDGPYVYENGCGIMIPDGYFDQVPPGAVRDGARWRVAIGSDIVEVRAALASLAAEAGFQYRSFGQMSPEELARATGLKGEELRMSRERHHDEPFVILGPYDPDRVREAAHRSGLTLTRGGRFFHLAGNCDKGRAVREIADLYRSIRGDLTTVGIGDSQNDLAMFREVDRPYLVQKPGGVYDQEIPPGAARRVAAIGPYGWRRAVEEVFADARS